MHNSISIMDDKRRLLVLSILLILPFVNEPIAIYMGANSLVSTIMLNFLFLLWAYFYFRKTINRNDVVLLLSFYFIYLIHYLLFPQTRKFYTETSMIFEYVMYLPLSIICVRKIRHWELFFHIFRPFVYVGSVIAIYIILFVNADARDESISYMQFSYLLLPVALTAYVLSRDTKEKIMYVLMAICATALLVFSARATVLFFAGFVMFYELLRVRRKATFYVALTAMVIISLFVYTYIDSIVEYLLGISLFQGSRFLMKLTSEEFFVSQGREEIMIGVERRLDSVGFEYSGFFGERYYLGGSYPHNFFLEIILSMGWLVGTVVITVFALLYFLSWLRTPYKKELLFFTFALFARFLISGSYVFEGRFWVFFFVVLSMLNKKSIINYGKNIGYRPRI